MACQAARWAWGGGFIEHFSWGMCFRLPGNRCECEAGTRESWWCPGGAVPCIIPPPAALAVAPDARYQPGPNQGGV